jgi:hypothetical protein
VVVTGSRLIIANAEPQDAHSFWKSYRGKASAGALSKVRDGWVEEAIKRKVHSQDIAQQFGVDWDPKKDTTLPEEGEIEGLKKIYASATPIVRGRKE